MTLEQKGELLRLREEVYFNQIYPEVMSRVSWLRHDQDDSPLARCLETTARQLSQAIERRTTKSTTTPLSFAFFDLSTVETMTQLKTLLSSDEIRANDILLKILQLHNIPLKMQNKEEESYGEDFYTIYRNAGGRKDFNGLFEATLPTRVPLVLAKFKYVYAPSAFISIQRYAGLEIL